MSRQSIRIGVVYNAFEARAGQGSEILSESSVEQAARDVTLTLLDAGYDAVPIPLKRSLTNFLQRLHRLECEALVNLCEGYRGRPQWEAPVAGLLEMEGFAFTGNPGQTLALCQDKFKTKAVLAAHGLPTAPYTLTRDPEEWGGLEFPLIVKPNCEDASLGIYSDSVVWNGDDLARQVEKIVRKYGQPALVESFIDGREFNVAVREQKGVEALPVSEIDFSRMPEGVPRICGYEAKWFEEHELFDATRPVCPADIDDRLRDRLQEKAVAAFRALGCRDYARVDFRMDKRGRLFILEVNPNPDISLNAGFARALKAAGVPYRNFWTQLVKEAVRRRQS
ncbi:ATP-grasp domain-containing protein [bacterium]|nr:ATP-grasp domain-containing protein [bacterium]